MAKRLKALSGLAEDYTIIGIACHLKDYRIALIINCNLHYCLKKVDDLIITEKESIRKYSLFIYQNPDDRRSYFLLSNHHPENKLIRSEKGVDYFLIVNDVLSSTQKSRIISHMQSAPNILAAYEIKPARMNQLDMIFEEIELQGSY